MDPANVEASKQQSRPSLQDFGRTSPNDSVGFVGPGNASGTGVPSQQPTMLVQIGDNTFTSGGKNKFTFSPSFYASPPPDVGERSSTSPATTPGTSPSDPSAGTVEWSFSKTLARTDVPFQPTLMRIAQAPEHDSEVYARLLLPKKLGWPLWLPNPRITLPDCYREQGVSIGDVGIITIHGEFDFLFNICRPANHPININGIPSNFVPLSSPSDGDVSIEPDAWKPGAYVLNGSVRARGPQPPGASIIISFECSPAEGAISVLPTGGARQDLLNIIDFFDYAGENAEHWYQFVNTPRRKGGLGRGAHNGALYLITGFDKTSSWGTGSYAGVTGKGSFPMHFQEHAATDDIDYAFAWSQSDLAATKHGPKMKEAERINPQQNQCMFLRGFRVAVAETMWEKLFLRQSTKVQQISNMSLPHLLSKSDWMPFASGSNSGLSNYFNISQRDGSGNTDAEGDGAIVIPDFPLSSSVRHLYDFLSDFGSHAVFVWQTLHPSDVINSYLLNQDKDAKVALTHDSQWCSVLEDGASKLPSPSEMLDRILSSYERVTVNNITYLTNLETKRQSNQNSAMATSYPILAFKDQAIGTEVAPPTTFTPTPPAKAADASAVPATTQRTDVPLAPTNAPLTAQNIASASSPPAPVSSTSAPPATSSGQRTIFQMQREKEAISEFLKDFIPDSERKQKAGKPLTALIHGIDIKAASDRFVGEHAVDVRFPKADMKAIEKDLDLYVKGGRSVWITGQTKASIGVMSHRRLLQLWETYRVDGRNKSIEPITAEVLAKDYKDTPEGLAELREFITGFLAVANGEDAG